MDGGRDGGGEMGRERAGGRQAGMYSGREVEVKWQGLVKAYEFRAELVVRGGTMAGQLVRK